MSDVVGCCREAGQSLQVPPHTIYPNLLSANCFGRHRVAGQGLHVRPPHNLHESAVGELFGIVLRHLVDVRWRHVVSGCGQVSASPPPNDSCKSAASEPFWKGLMLFSSCRAASGVVGWVDSVCNTIDTNQASALLWKTFTIFAGVGWCRVESGNAGWCGGAAPQSCKYHLKMDTKLRGCLASAT